MYNVMCTVTAKESYGYHTMCCVTTKELCVMSSDTSCDYKGFV